MSLFPKSWCDKLRILRPKNPNLEPTNTLNTFYKTSVSANDLKDEEEDRNNVKARETAADLETLNIKPKYIVCNKNNIKIEWNNVLLWTDKEGFKMPETHLKEQKERHPKQFVIHYDACARSKATFEVLKERGLSVHFLIDGDGTIFQLCDVSNICWHAKGVNTTSVGVEICNPVFLKHNNVQEKLWGMKRQVINSCIVHGKEVGPILDFYPIQIQACKVLLKALNEGLNIKLQCPLGSDQTILKTIIPEPDKYEGVLGHFNINLQKQDPSTFPIEQLINWNVWF